MQLSTSTSAPDSNPLPLPSTLVGSPASGDAAPGAFADFLPAPVPAGASLNAAAPILPGTIPGGIAFTLAAPIPVEAVADFVAPTSTQTPVDVSAETPVCAPGSTSAAVPSAEDTPAISDPFQPPSTSPRPARALPAAAPALRSARALPRADAAPTENIAAPPALTPIPTETVIALPLDFVATSPAPEKTSDLLAADEMPARLPAARNPWIMPATPQFKAALTGTPASGPARDSASAQEIATFADAVELSAPPADPAPDNVSIDRAPSAEPAIPSVRALPRAEVAPAGSIVLPLAPAPLPDEAVIALPLDLGGRSPTPLCSNAPSDLLAADEMPARPPAARNPWIMPTTPQFKAALTGTPTSGPARDSASAQEIATFADAVEMSSPPGDPAPVNVSIDRAPSAEPAAVNAPIDSRVAATDSRLRVSPVFASERAPEATALLVTTAVTSGLSNEFASEISSKITVPPSENRPAPRAATHTEKFAAARSEIFTAPVSTPSLSNKNFLTTEDDEVRQASPSIGITVAESSVTMTAAPTLHLAATTPAAVLDVNVVNVPAAHPASIPSAPAATPAEITAAAHKAVDAVLASTERLASATQSSVNLKFSVGGADLDVRVEVRAGAVHATFRTDSPELRTALAQEWQSTTSQPADHTLRLAPPVFAAGDRSGTGAGTGFSGEQSSQQARDQNARSPAEFSLPGSARGRFTTASSTGTSGVSALPARSAPATTLHLHAFA